MSSELFALSFFVGILSPAVAIICAARFYIRHSRTRAEPKRRFPIAAYVLILLGCAVVGYWFGLAFGIDLACVRYPSGNLCGLFGIFAAGPLGASLAILFVGALILFLPPDVETVRADARWRPSSAYLNLWRGQYSLAASFWGFFVLGTYIVMIITFFLPPLRPVLVLGYVVVATVGVWRSANAFVAARGGRGSLPQADLAKITAAKIVVVLWSFWLIGNLARVTLGHWYIVK
jgi:hypothetical protein